MEKINRFEDLEIWQKATELAVQVYKLCESGPIKNNYGLRDQVQRAVISISSNIAEGFEYNNNKNFIRFLYYAKASCGELRSQLYIISTLEMMDKKAYEDFYNELMVLSKRIASFIKYLKKFEEDKVGS